MRIAVRPIRPSSPTSAPEVGRRSAPGGAAVGAMTVTWPSTSPEPCSTPSDTSSGFAISRAQYRSTPMRPRCPRCPRCRPTGRGCFRGIARNVEDPEQRLRIAVSVPEVLGTMEVWAQACVAPGSRRAADLGSGGLGDVREREPGPPGVARRQRLPPVALRILSDRIPLLPRRHRERSTHCRTGIERVGVRAGRVESQRRLKYRIDHRSTYGRKGPTISFVPPISSGVAAITGWRSTRCRRRPRPDRAQPGP